MDRIARLGLFLLSLAVYIPLLFVMFSMEGCQTTSERPYIPLENSRELHQACKSETDSDACIEIAVNHAQNRDYSSAVIFAKHACGQGNREGCDLRDELQAADARYAQRQERNAYQDAALMKLYIDSANQIGTIGGRKAGDPQPIKTKCITKWNDWTRSTETICEGE